jgi:hypothetical protein
MTVDWQANGFAEPPRLRAATGAERLFRAWGGDPRRKWGNTDLIGVCFSLNSAQSRWHAETLYAVMEYQNPVRFLTEFSIAGSTPLWIGRVHPGDPRSSLGSVSGSQVLVERAYLHLVKEVSTKPLRNDLGGNEVFTGRLPRVHS